MKLPCYPLVTIDPLMSIWSKTEKLYDSDTILWCGIEKKMCGIVTVDGIPYRFLGKGKEKIIPQSESELSPLIMSYVFENTEITMKIDFWSPFFADNLHEMALPCGLIKYSIQSNDGNSHEVSVKITLDNSFMPKKLFNPLVKTIEGNNHYYAKMGVLNQSPLKKSGDHAEAEWGYICISGEKLMTSEKGISAIDESENGSFVIAFDDIYSLEYFKEKYKGFWTEKWKSIDEVIDYCTDNIDALYQKALNWNERILSDAESFGEDYQFILSAATRQIFAGHKLVRNSKGELLYFSKECDSNGCINTVDVSYPAIPFFLLYNPDLVEGMMTGIFRFAKMKIWKYDFAPHDIGQYPIANGQVYGLEGKYNKKKNKIFLYDVDPYNFNSQMPVEECGNMLIMAYTHYVFSKNDRVIRKNYNLLLKWATYLKNVGIELANQLCTDDFAGHSEKNVNLAIKGIMGLACFGRICEALGYETDSLSVAQEYANALMKYANEDGSLPFAESVPDSWSLKYNLVWDMVLDFNLFPASLSEAESAKYVEKADAFGVPLDSRKRFTKTDWMLWASVLDASKTNITLFSKLLRGYLEETEDVVPFSDWINTDVPKFCAFRHRTVQGGLWMPVLAKYCEENL